MKEKFGAVSVFTAKEGKGDELASLMLQASKILRNMKGYHKNMVSRCAENENIIYVTELWDSKEDHEKAIESEEIIKIIFLAIPLFAKKPGGDGFHFEVVDNPVSLTYD